jgi:GNAT superfamily N-acetyltransferase
MNGIADTTFRFLTLEEKDRAGGIGSDHEFAVAQDMAGNVVSMFSFDNPSRGPKCDVCVWKCAQTVMLYTAPNRRGEGIFKALYEWAMQEKEIDRIYESSSAPDDADLISWKYRILPAKFGRAFIEYAAAEARAAEVMALINEAVNSDA